MITLYFIFKFIGWLCRICLWMLILPFKILFLPFKGFRNGFAPKRRDDDFWFWII